MPASPYAQAFLQTQFRICVDVQLCWAPCLHDVGLKDIFCRMKDLRRKDINLEQQYVQMTTREFSLLGVLKPHRVSSS